MEKNKTDSNILIHNESLSRNRMNPLMPGGNKKVTHT